MSLDTRQMKLDEIARNLCKPLGCRVVRCISSQKSGGCSSQMAALNQCISKKRAQINLAIKEGRSLSTVSPILEDCEL